MKPIQITLLISVLFGTCSALSQGFINLNFEAATIPGNLPPNSAISSTNAIPGWTAYISGSPQSIIAYNSTVLGAAAVSLEGTNGPFPSFSGLYSVALQATFLATPVTNTAAIGQTGTIPPTAQSLMFWANTSLSGLATDMRVTFDGLSIPYFAIGSGSGYTMYGADIGALSGQSGELLFTAYNNTYAEIDNIRFLSQPIPEPSTCALVALGALLLGWRFRPKGR